MFTISSKQQQQTVYMITGSFVTENPIYKKKLFTSVLNLLQFDDYETSLISQASS